MNAIEIIQAALRNAKRPVVAFSGGKDSTVVLHLVRSVDANVPAVFCNTGVEAPETIAFIKTVPNLVELHPERGFWDIVREHGLPKPKSKSKSHGGICCRILKEKPAEDYYTAAGVDLVFTGITSSESHNRKLLSIHRGAYYQMKSGLYKCHPIIDWSIADVWGYIRDNGLTYNKLYDGGSDRVGCQPCTAYRIWKKNLARENPKLLRWVLKVQGQSQLSDTCTEGS